MSSIEEYRYLDKILNCITNAPNNEITPKELYESVTNTPFKDNINSSQFKVVGDDLSSLIFDGTYYQHQVRFFSSLSHLMDELYVIPAINDKNETVLRLKSKGREKLSHGFEQSYMEEKRKDELNTKLIYAQLGSIKYSIILSIGAIVISIVALVMQGIQVSNESNSSQCKGNNGNNESPNTQTKDSTNVKDSTNFSNSFHNYIK